MHRFPHFTRSTHRGEFAWVGAFIFKINFMGRGKFFGGQFSLVVIVLVAIFLGVIVRGGFSYGAVIWGQSSRGRCRGAIFLGCNCPDTGRMYDAPIGYGVQRLWKIRLREHGKVLSGGRGGFKKLYEIVAVVDLRLGDNVEVAWSEWHRLWTFW